MKFTKKVLNNGLIVLHEKRDVPVTTVMLGVRYGSAYESEKEKGIAHFIEHLCFKGTEKRTPKEIASEIEKVGGILNAFTSEEVTAYHCKLPSEHLEIAMDVIFDIFFNPVFPEEDVKKEAKVICEEIRMYHDNPRFYVMEKVKENMYKKPFGMSAAGKEEVIKSMARKELIEKHRKIYSPENSILAVVGKNDFEEVLKLAEKFSVLRKGNTEKIKKIEKINLRKKETRKDMQQANIALGIHFPFSEGERYAAEVFASILGEGMSSKLFSEIREKRGLAYAVKTEIELGKNYGYMVIYIGTSKEKIDEVIELCLKEFKKMGGISERELEDGKMQVAGNYKVASEGSDETALNLMLKEARGEAEDYYRYEENVRKVSLGHIKKLAEISDYSYSVLSN